MAPIRPAAPSPSESDPLAQRFDELWRRQEQLAIEHGDLDAYVDQLAKDMFGSPEASKAIEEYLLRVTGEMVPDDEDSLGDDGW